jgi:hypothetical protein
MKTFRAFTFKGRNFIAIINTAGNIHILDDQGVNYGTWMSITGFKKWHSDESTIRSIVGFAVPAVRHIEEESLLKLREVDE